MLQPAPSPVQVVTGGGDDRTTGVYGEIRGSGVRTSTDPRHRDNGGGNGGNLVENSLNKEKSREEMRRGEKREED